MKYIASTPIKSLNTAVMNQVHRGSPFYSQIMSCPSITTVSLTDEMRCLKCNVKNEDVAVLIETSESISAKVIDINQLFDLTSNLDHPNEKLSIVMHYEDYLKLDESYLSLPLSSPKPMIHLVVNKNRPFCLFRSIYGDLSFLNM
jgi:hypothetical protein